MTAPHIVIIASVEWRKENLVALLDDIEHQTRVPEHVVVRLDGYSNRGVAWVTQRIVRPSLEDTRTVTIAPGVKAGAGARWLLAAAFERETDIGPTAILSVIDDDFRIEPNYLQVCYDHVANAEVPTAIGWLGETPDFIRWSADMPSPTECISLGAGLLTCRLRDLAGIDTFEEVDRYFKPPGDDEALVSYWLWKKGVKLIRPAGAASATSVDELQYDKRASFIDQGEHRHCVLRLNLKRKHGWTTYRLPAEFAGREMMVDGVAINPAASRTRGPR